MLALCQQIICISGLTRFYSGARYRVRTCDPYRVKVLYYRVNIDLVP